MIDMKNTSSDKARILFRVPSRGLIGYQNTFLTQSRNSLYFVAPGGWTQGRTKIRFKPKVKIPWICCPRRVDTRSILFF